MRNTCWAQHLPFAFPVLFLSTVSVTLSEQKQERPGWSVISQLTDFPFPDSISFVKKKKKWWISLFYVCLQWDLMHSAHLIFWNTGSVQQQANHNWARQEG